ncbi:YcnI family protein [Dactylosporangium sp. NPDC051484]|uniref:YcnI family copper-binding membrane protein n=1 Tax=Dactylosporangium sp. NPDC051484 TaxID=3154942 RepID=UPI00344D3A14
MRNWLAGAAAAAALVLIPAPADAHVRVDDSSAPKRGGYGAVRLSVPTESEKASTVGLIVTIPEDVTLTSAKVLPIAGWTAKVETVQDRVTRIVWQAKDGGLGPSEFGVFTFSAGPWPKDKSAVPLPTTQQYSDGSTVVWDQVALDASEPEHPAPIVVLGAASAEHHHGAVTVDAAREAGEASRKGQGAFDGANVARWGLIALAVALSTVALLRRAR